MATVMKRTPLIVIVGPTASGKTDTAISLAQAVNGEVICADSRTVYKKLDIGTAKPSDYERRQVPHWGLDLVEPDERFTAAQFQWYAQQKIAEIRARSRIPILVGGSGLYIDGVIYDYQFGPEAQVDLRNELEQKSIIELQDYCINNNIELPKNERNKRHLVRAIEQKGVNHKRNCTIIDTSLIVGITTDRVSLQQRIETRMHTMFAQGVVDEATSAAKTYGWDAPGLTGSIYQIIRKMISNSLQMDIVESMIITRDMQLAKRQMTWFRRNPSIKWHADKIELLEQCQKFINQTATEES